MENKSTVAAVLAVMALVGFLAIFGFLCLKEVPAGNKDFFNTALIALVGLCGTGFGFYLGAAYTKASASPTPALSATVKETAVGSEAGRIHLNMLFLVALILGTFFIFGLQGCATSGGKQDSPLMISGKTLLAMQQTIVSAAEIGDSLCKQGTLNPDQCNQLSTYYTQAGAAYDLAAEALIAANQVNSAKDDQDKFQAALQNFTVLFGDFITLAGKFNLIPAQTGGAK